MKIANLEIITIEIINTDNQIIEKQILGLQKAKEIVKRYINFVKREQSKYDGIQLISCISILKENIYADAHVFIDGSKIFNDFYVKTKLANN